MKYVRIFFWLMTAVCFGYTFYLWGGIRDTPHIGNQLMKDAPKESFLATTYMVIGSKANGTTGQTSNAVAHVAKKFPKLIASEPAQLATLQVDDFKAAQGTWASFAYAGGPLLLVLSLVLHWMREKKVRTFGMKG